MGRLALDVRQLLFSNQAPSPVSRGVQKSFIRAGNSEYLSRGLVDKACRHLLSRRRVFMDKPIQARKAQGRG